MLIPSNFLWRTSPSLNYATSHYELRRVGHGGVELEEHCSYLILGLVAASADELQIHILLVALEMKMRVIHFCLTPLEYIMTGTKSKLIMMNVRW